MAENARDNSNESFPWHLGVYDAHCHPTDTMTSISSISEMKAKVLTVMATRSQDQNLVSSVADSHSVKSTNPEQWSRDECVVPCFGWHPWFSYQMYITDEERDSMTNNETNDKLTANPEKLQGDEKVTHYQNVLKPKRDELSDEDRRIFLSLPDPTPFQSFLSQTRSYLQKHPFALIGEIGLDRSFRIPEAWIPEFESHRNGDLTPGGREGRRLSPFNVDLAHQKNIFKMQLQLAAETGRAVSIHGVQAHGMVFETLKEMWEGHEKEVLSKRQRKKHGTDQENVPNSFKDKPSENDTVKPYPPRICLHSYSGNPSNFKQYLSPTIPIDIFASFSTAINLSDQLEKETPKAFVEMIKSVPDHMLLVESDLHTAGNAMDERLEDIVRRVCKIKGWGLEEGVTILGGNWRRFVFG